MNREQFEEMLNEMDPRERELVLAADDAYDALYSYQIEKAFGVTVVCNPGGDRTKISIDGVIMDHEQFAQWLLGKQLEKCGQELSESAPQDEYTKVREDLPTEIDLDELGLDYNASDREIRKAIKNYTGYFVAKDADLYVAGNTVYDIEYGRKASSSELD